MVLHQILSGSFFIADHHRTNRDSHRLEKVEGVNSDALILFARRPMWPKVTKGTYTILRVDTQAV